MMIFFIHIEALLTIEKRLYFLLRENLHNIILILFEHLIDIVIYKIDIFIFL